MIQHRADQISQLNSLAEPLAGSDPDVNNQVSFSVRFLKSEGSTFVFPVESRIRSLTARGSVLSGGLLAVQGYPFLSLD